MITPSKEEHDLKLIKEHFNAFAREQGYENGAEMFEELGLNKDKYIRYKSEVPISGSDLQTLCWEIGTAEVIDFIRFAPGDKERYRRILEEFWFWNDRGEKYNQMATLWKSDVYSVGFIVAATRNRMLQESLAYRQRSSKESYANMRNSMNTR